MTFPILSDKDNTIINIFGLEDPRYAATGNEGIPYAALYIIEKTGKMTWARVSRNYKIRPTNEQIRQALDSL